MKTFLDKLLNYYNMSLEDYQKLCKEVTFSDIPDLTYFDNGEISKNCLLEHIKNNDKIAIYGDYDADGILATSIMVYALRKTNYENYIFKIPTRELDGYAINDKFVDECIEQNVKLIITVDNGVTANSAINKAIDNDIDVIIADHHEFDPNNLPKTPYIIHPLFSKNKEIICSGGFTSYILSTSIIDRENPYILSLAGMSIITDMMPLIGYNKDAVKLALKFINEYKFEPIMYLNNYSYIDEGSISSSIGPKINSFGRILSDDSINLIVEFLLTKNKSKIEQLGRKIDEINELRKEKSFVDVNLDEFNEENANIVCLDLEEGLIGLVANRVLNESNKLTIVFSSTQIEGGLIKGSARSREGISLIDLFEENKDIIENSGGHAFAAGVVIKAENFEEFKYRVFKFSKNKEFRESEKPVIKISANEITYENFKILQNFGPFGEKNKKPEFFVSDFPVRSLNYSKTREHIFTKLDDTSSIIMFHYNPKDLENKTIISFEGTFNINVFKNKFSTKFIIKKIF